VPVAIPTRKGDPIMFATDEGIRGETTAQTLGKLRPAFDPNGTITAGSSSQISDGAAVVILMSEKKAAELGVTVLAEILSHGMVAGPDASLVAQPARAIKKAAEKIGLDISTISRVANSKFVQTEFGTYKLKFFFSESLQTESGEEVSTREVKKILTDIIESENKKNPHSDEKLTEMLMEKGYNIARRTVAKYREQLNIPVARLRKEL
jgi:hypothetical protein